MERHHQLSASLHDAKGEMNALRMLGEIATKQGQHEVASSLFRESMQATPRVGSDARDLAKVKLGVAMANIKMADRMRELASESSLL
jgi:hypothetical protein